MSWWTGTFCVTKAIKWKRAILEKRKVIDKACSWHFIINEGIIFNNLVVKSFYENYYSSFCVECQIIPINGLGEYVNNKRVSNYLTHRAHNCKRLKASEPNCSCVMRRQKASLTTQIFWDVTSFNFSFCIISLRCQI